MKKLFLLLFLCVFPVTAIKSQDQEKPCDPCERAAFWAERAKKAATREEFDKMWAKGWPYHVACKEKTEEAEEREIKAIERASLGFYLLSGLLVAKIIQDFFKK